MPEQPARSSSNDLEGVFSELRLLDDELRETQNGLADLLARRTSRRSASAPAAVSVDRTVEPITAERWSTVPAVRIETGGTGDVGSEAPLGPAPTGGLAARLPTWWPNVATALIALGVFLVLLAIVTRI